VRASIGDEFVETVKHTPAKPAPLSLALPYSHTPALCRPRGRCEVVARCRRTLPRAIEVNSSISPVHRIMSTTKPLEQKNRYADFSRFTPAAEVQIQHNAFLSLRTGFVVQVSRWRETNVHTLVVVHDEQQFALLPKHDSRSPLYTIFVLQNPGLRASGVLDSKAMQELEEMWCPTRSQTEAVLGEEEEDEIDDVKPVNSAKGRSQLVATGEVEMVPGTADFKEVIDVSKVCFVGEGSACCCNDDDRRVLINIESSQFDFRTKAFFRKQGCCTAREAARLSSSSSSSSSCLPPPTSVPFGVVVADDVGVLTNSIAPVSSADGNTSSSSSSSSCVPPPTSVAFGVDDMGVLLINSTAPVDSAEGDDCNRDEDDKDDDVLRASDSTRVLRLVDTRFASWSRLDRKRKLSTLQHDPGIRKTRESRNMGRLSRLPSASVVLDLLVLTVEREEREKNAVEGGAVEDEIGAKEVGAHDEGDAGRLVVALTPEPPEPPKPNQLLIAVPRKLAAHSSSTATKPTESRLRDVLVRRIFSDTVFWGKGRPIFINDAAEMRPVSRGFREAGITEVDVDNAEVLFPLETLMRCNVESLGVALTDGHASWGRGDDLVLLFGFAGGSIYCNLETKQRMMESFPDLFSYSDKKRHFFSIGGAPTLSAFFAKIEGTGMGKIIVRLVWFNQKTLARFMLGPPKLAAGREFSLANVTAAFGEVADAVAGMSKQLAVAGRKAETALVEVQTAHGGARGAQFGADFEAGLRIAVAPWAALMSKSQLNLAVAEDVRHGSTSTTAYLLATVGQQLIAKAASASLPSGSGHFLTNLALDPDAGLITTDLAVNITFPRGGDCAATTSTSTTTPTTPLVLEDDALLWCMDMTPDTVAGLINVIQQEVGPAYRVKFKAINLFDPRLAGVHGGGFCAKITLRAGEENNKSDSPLGTIMTIKGYASSALGLSRHIAGFPHTLDRRYKSAITVHDALCIMACINAFLSNQKAQPALNALDKLKGGMRIELRTEGASIVPEVVQRVVLAFVQKLLKGCRFIGLPLRAVQQTVSEWLYKVGDQCFRGTRTNLLPRECLDHMTVLLILVAYCPHKWYTRVERTPTGFREGPSPTGLVLPRVGVAVGETVVVPVGEELVVGEVTIFNNFYMNLYACSSPLGRWI